MKKIVLNIAALLVILFAPYAKGQMLETVDLSVQGMNYDTYVLGINNSGYICGYYNDGTKDVGFIISNRGKLLPIYPMIGTGNGVRVQSINDHGVAVVTKVENGVTTSYKTYIDTISFSISNSVALNFYQSSSKPFDINNNNDVSGWYNVVQRWLFVHHDSIVPVGNSAWEANRFSTPGPTYYNTYGMGINDANKVVGYYIDGILTESFVYNNLTGTFTALPFSYNKVELHSINNNDKVCGQFRQNNGVWMSFIGDVSTGSLTQFTPLDVIFDNNTIQSVASDINDKVDVVGSFYHPGTNKWVGYIYHASLPEYRMPDFNFTAGSWAMRNGQLGGNAVWPIGYWLGTDYMNTDPYMTNSVLPLVDQNIMDMSGITMVHDSMSPKWSSFAEEVDTTGIANTSDINLLNKYNAFIKPLWFTLWYKTSFKSFKGLCFGFTYSTLLKHFQDSTYAEWMNMPLNTNLGMIQNSDYTAIKSIERFNIKQFSASLHKAPSTEYASVGLWEGLYDLKNNFRKSIYKCDVGGLALLFGPGLAHSVLPYKVHSPATLPFDYPVPEYDTMFIYDPNHPQDSAEYLRVRSDRYYMEHDSVYSPFYNDPLQWVGKPLLKRVTFHQPKLSEVLLVQHSFAKTTSAADYNSNVIFSLQSDCHYQIQGTNNSNATLDGNGYSISSDVFSTYGEGNLEETLPTTHIMDTSEWVNIHNNNYMLGSMLFQQINKRRMIGISRQAASNETDHSSIKDRIITYGNPDATTKNLTIYKVETSATLDEAVNIMARGVCAAQGDSIVAESNTATTFTIKKINGTSNCTYDLSVYSIQNGEVIEFHSPVELNGTTTHIIDPYFQGISGTEIAVLIDNGNDGTTDDTLFITGWPVDIPNNMSGNGIKVYPNPAHDNLTIDIATSGHYNMMITDMIGRTVYNKSSLASGKTNISMAAYPAGMYLIQISDNKGTQLFKDKIIRQ